LLAADNILYVKVAVWLNDTGLPIHIEPTWVSVFQVEDGSGRPIALTPAVSAMPTSGHNTMRATIKRTPN